MKIGLSSDVYSAILSSLESHSAGILEKDIQFVIHDDMQSILSGASNVLLMSLAEFRAALQEDPFVCLTKSFVLLMDHEEPDEALKAISEGADGWVCMSDLDSERALMVFRTAEQRRSFRLRFVRQLPGRYSEEFLISMCHEIRTPLSAIYSICDKLRVSCRGDYLERLVALLSLSCNSLRFLVDDILDFSSTCDGNMSVHKSNFSPTAVIEEAVCMVASHAKNKGLELYIDIDTDVPETLFSDPYRVRQILINFLANAVKFTDRGSVSVRAHLYARDGGSSIIRLEVWDTGIGIEDDQRDHLFEPFFQASHPKEQLLGGTGLGLAISKRIADLLGCSIDCSSVRGEGTVFWIDLPVYDDETTEEILIPETELMDNLKTLLQTGEVPVFEMADCSNVARISASVLLVEDNPVNRELTSMDLVTCGVSVDLAATGLDALERCRASIYDLILMDCQLPDLDGYETTRRIRSYEREIGRSPVPIVALTGSAVKDERTRCLMAGMNDFLSKPVARSDLIALLSRYCGSGDSGKTTPENRFMELGRQLDSQVVQCTLKVFADDTRKLLFDLAEAIEREDLGLCQTAAHKLRGTCLYMGFSELGQLFEFIESIEEMALVHSAFDFASTSLGEYLKEVDSWLIRVD